MEKIFYADKSAFATDAALKKILIEYYGKSAPEILRTKNGKPYVENGPFFSVTHTKNRLYIAFSEEEIGLDAESITRVPYYETIVKKFSPAEQEEILNAEDFLRHWVVKESTVKYLGGTLAQDLYKLHYAKGNLSYNEQPLSVQINLLRHEEFILSVCGNGKLENATFIELLP